MVEFTKEETIPKIEGTFKPAEETLEIAAILEGLEPGQVIRFPVDGNQPLPGRVRDSNRLKARCFSASKRATGRYRVAIRNKDVYVERLD